MSQRKQWPTVQAAEVPEHVSRQTIKKDNIAKFASEAGHGMSLLAKISAGGMMPKRPQAQVTHEGQGQRVVNAPQRTDDVEREREELKRETGGKQKTLLTMIAPPSGQDYRAVLKSRGAVTVGASVTNTTSTETSENTSAQPIKILPPPSNTALTPKRAAVKSGSAPTTPSAPIDYRAVLKKSTPDKTAETKAREEQEARDRAEKEREAKEKKERENKEREEKERHEREEKEKLERENKEREEKERLEREHAEKERHEREEKEKKEREEKERLEREAREHAEKEKHEREEKERVEREEQEKQAQLEREKHEQEERARVEREEQERQRLARETEERERHETEARVKEETAARQRAEEEERARHETTELAQQREAESERLQREEEERVRKEEKRAAVEREAREQQVREQEQVERENKERLEREEKEKLEREEQEKQAQLERENKEREEKERLEREEKERLEHENKEREEKERLERETKEREEKEKLEREAREHAEKERHAREEKERVEREEQEKQAQLERENKERIAREEKDKHAQQAAQSQHSELQRAHESQSQSAVSDEARARRETELAETQRIEEQIKLRAEQLKSQSPRRDNVPTLNLGASPTSPRTLSTTKHSPREFKPVTPRSANILSRVNIFESLVKKASEEQLIAAMSPRKTSPRPATTPTPRAPLNKTGSTFTNRPPTQSYRSIVTTPLVTPVVANKSKDYLVPESQTGTYTYEELVLRPANLERSRLEAYLSDEDFERVFKVRREVFNAWPKWKQTKAKQDLALF